MPVAELTTSVDSFVRENRPSENFGQERELKLNGGAGGDDGMAYLFFNRPFPLKATIREAKLYITPSGAWASNNQLTVRRITQPWAENKIKWSNRPGTVGTNEVVKSVVDQPDQEEIAIDITAMLADVASGGAWYGVRIELTQNQLRKFYSAEANVPDRRPRLVIDWGAEPYPPSKLAPSGGKAVSVQKLVLDWKFTDNRGDTKQAYSQVQISASSSFAAPEYDSGKLANQQSNFDTALTAWAGISAGETKWWRVKVWDGTNLASDWSAPASFTRNAQSVLTLVNPPAPPDNYVEETTPPIDWTLTGGTQERAEVYLWRCDENFKVVELLKRWPDEETDTSVTVPKNLLKSGRNYRVRVRAWDDVDRAVTPGDPDYLEVERNFTYNRAGTPAAVETLDATIDGAKVVLEWTRTLQPDWFSLRVDGSEEMQRIDPEEVFVSGSTYRMGYWGLRPGHESTLEIEAVVNDGGKWKHSAANPEVDVTTDPIGATLVDLETGDRVEFRGGNEPDIAIGESATTFYPIGSRSPVRITDNVRGYEGSISGLVIGRAQRNALLDMKESFGEYRLIIGDLNFPVTLEDVSIAPAHQPGGDKFNASAAFFQSDEFGKVIRWTG